MCVAAPCQVIQSGLPKGDKEAVRGQRIMVVRRALPVDYGVELVTAKGGCFPQLSLVSDPGSRRGRIRPVAVSML